MTRGGVLPDRAAWRPLSQFRCAACGYGASCRIAPERCPMCSGTVWSFEAGRPSPHGFGGADADAAVARETP